MNLDGRGQVDLKAPLCSWMIFRALAFCGSNNLKVAFGGTVIKAIIIIIVTIKGTKLLKLAITSFLAKYFKYQSFGFWYTVEYYCQILSESYNWARFAIIKHKADLERQFK